MDKTPHLILGILWQLVRHIFGAKIKNRISGGKLPRKLAKTLSKEISKDLELEKQMSSAEEVKKRLSEL